MSDIWATKDNHEHEEAEAERLVRPNPKMKPPRRDRRRERMNERDTDTSGDPDLKGDPDMSLNYKSIGGSLRGYVRLALEQEKDDDKVKVRKKDTGWVGEVSRKTLKENGSQYEEVKDEDAGGKAPAQLAENHRLLKELAAQSEEFDNRLKSFPKGDGGGMVKNNPNFPAAPFFPGVKLPPGVKTVKDVMDALSMAPAKAPKTKGGPKPTPTPAPAQEEKPKAESPPAEPPKPETPAHDDKPEDSAKVPEEPKEKAPEAPAAEKPATSPLDALPEENRKYLENLAKKFQKEQAEGKKPKTVEEALGGVDPNTLPEPFKSAILAEQAKSQAKDKPKEDKPKEDKPKEDTKTKGEGAEKKEPESPWPGRRQPHPSEVREAQRLMAKALPAKLANKYMNIHPDDAKRLVNSYKGVAALGAFESSDDLKKSLDGLKSHFTLDTKSVEPPKTWKKGKKEVPYDSLTPEEQKAAHDQHALEVVAYNTAMRDRAITTLRSKGLSGPIAAQTVDLQLKKPIVAKSPEEATKQYEARRAKLKEAAKNHFIAGVSTSKPPMSESSRKKVLETAASLNPEAQHLAYADLKADDYRAVTNKYLKGSDPKNLLSEYDKSPKLIAKINQALEEFKTRAADYPNAVRKEGPDPARVFRSKVLSRLKQHAPDRYKDAKEFFQRHDAAEFDKKQAQYERDSERYKKDEADYSKRFLAWEARKEKHESKGDPYRKEGFSEPAPEPPIKPEPPVMPEGYYEASQKTPGVRKVKNDVETLQKRMGLGEGGLLRKVVDKFKSRKKQAAESPYSSYGWSELTMGTPLPSGIGTREAVYHGVKPTSKGTGAYDGWEQAHVCDLGSSDSNTILASAREWLKSPILSKSVEGMLPDARFRAALDLAIRDAEDGKYSAAITANLYNDLLKKLSGSKEASFRIREAASEIASVDPVLAYSMLDYIEGASDSTLESLELTARPAARVHLASVMADLKAIDSARSND